MRCINIVYDENDNFSNQLIDRIYKEYSYDCDNLFSVNLGYCIKLIPITGDLECIDRRADLIIWLITYNFFTTPEAYVKKYQSLRKTGVEQLPISFCRNGARLMDDINTLVVKDESSETRIMCIIAQKLIKNKIDIFISYYRTEGTSICEKIHHTIQRLPGYDTFVDLHNIEYGTEIQTEIELKLTDSAVICINTDGYAQRFWCVKELLVAKQNYVPLIVADCVTSTELRRNPNSGNVPVIRLSNDPAEEDILKTVLTLIKEVLRKKIFESKITEDGTTRINLWKAPELSDFAEKSVKTVYYPAPPICLCERKYYESISTGTQFRMLNQIDFTQGKKLRVCISLSDFQDNHYIHKNYTDSLASEVMRYLVYRGYQINYGGDWRKSGYTERFLDFVKAYRFYEDPSDKIFVNYFSNINQENTGEILSRMYNFGRLVEIPLERKGNEIDKATSLTKMRKRMIQESDALVVIGGRLYSDSGYLSGIAEEVAIAYQHEKPVYIVGGQGGAAKKVADILTDPRSYSFVPSLTTEAAQSRCQYVNKILKSKNINEFSSKNKLSVEENKELFSSTDIAAICNLLIKGLAEIP